MVLACSAIAFIQVVGQAAKLPTPRPPQLSAVTCSSSCFFKARLLLANITVIIGHENDGDCKLSQTEINKVRKDRHAPRSTTTATSASIRRRLA